MSYLEFTAIVNFHDLGWVFTFDDKPSQKCGSLNCREKRLREV